MIPSAHFDTHATVKHLRSSGFDEPQAEALTEAIAQAQGAHLKELATKHGLGEITGQIDKLRQAVEHDTDELRQATKQDLDEVKRDIDELRQATRRDIHDLKETMATKQEIAELRAEILKWMFGVAAGQIAIIVALLKLIP